MSITSFYFLALVTVGVLVYYVVPKSIQWMILLVLSAVFYYFAATPCTIGYLVVSTMIAYLSTMWIQKSKGQILRPTPNTAPLICGACYNTQPEDLLTMA